MLFTALDLVAFWVMPWSQRFRRACLWFTSNTQPLQGKKPNSDAPWWLRPLFLQHWVGQAVAARLAWLEAHPQVTPYRYGHESELCWDEAAWKRYDDECLRDLRESTLIWIFGMEVERLLRLAQQSPWSVNNGDWTRAALGIAGHVAQLYGELKRRHTALPARALLREELRQFVAWTGGADRTWLPLETGTAR